MDWRRLSGVPWPLFRRILGPYHQYEPANSPQNGPKRSSEIHPPSTPYTLLRASLQKDVESRIRQVRQIWTTTCWCISGIFAHMLWFEDGVLGGFWAGAHFVGMLLTCRCSIFSTAAGSGCLG